jgi:hypothetical protein
MRLVRRKLVVRLETELTDKQVAMLNEEFADLVEKGKIEKSPALAEESNEPDLALKPRLVFSYHQKSPVRLNQMFLRINELGKTLHS